MQYPFVLIYLLHIFVKLADSICFWYIQPNGIDWYVISKWTIDKIRCDTPSFFYFDHIAYNFVYKWFTNQARSKIQYIASNLFEGMITKHFFSFSRWKVMRFSIIETCTIYHICTFVYHQWSSHLVKIKLLLWTFKKMFRIDYLKLRFLSKT